MTLLKLMKSVWIWWLALRTYFQNSVGFFLSWLNFSFNFPSDWILNFQVTVNIVKYTFGSHFSVHLQMWNTAINYHLDDQKGENVLSNHEPKSMGTQRKKKILYLCIKMLTMKNKNTDNVLFVQWRANKNSHRIRRKDKCREYSSIIKHWNIHRL